MEYIYKHYFRIIKRFVLENSGNIEDAKDIFQEAIFVIYDKIQKNELKLECSLKTYLYSVSRNMWHEQLRYKKKMITQFKDFENYIDFDTDFEILNKEILADYLFHKHLLSLTENCQKIIRFLLNKVSSKEISRIMGFKSEHYANKRKYQCKQNLFNRIKNDPLYKIVIKNE